MRSHLIYHVWDTHLNDEPFIVRLCIVVNRLGGKIARRLRNKKMDGRSMSVTLVIERR